VNTSALRWFQLVADGMTVTEVSDLAFISQPAVSRALDRLDHELGTPLLRKDGRVLKMTRAGAVFKRHVDAMLLRLDDGLAAVSQLVDPETGTVVLATQRSVGTWLVPNLIGTFHRLHPAVRFEVRPVRDTAPSDTAAPDRPDLEVTTVRPADPSTQWLHLLDEPLWLAVPPDHRLARRKAVTLYEVSTDPFIVLRPPSLLWQQCQALCGAAGFAPRVAFDGEDVATLRGFVAAGLGVAVVPALHEGSPEPVDGRVRHIGLLDAGAVREIGLGWSRHGRLMPSADLFRSHLLERVKNSDLPTVLAL
jgi:DNA-binding transcriptional LysR family regulator